MQFEIIGEIRSVELIESGRRVRDRRRLNREYGRGAWRNSRESQPFVSAMVRFSKQNFTGIKRMASAKKRPSSKSRLSASSRSVRGPSPAAALRAATARTFAVCVENEGYKASLELRKIYEVLEDPFARDHELIRVIDESGEDYLYPTQFFVRVELPATLQQKLEKIA